MEFRTRDGLLRRLAFRFGADFFFSFTGFSILFYLLAAFLSAWLVMSGLDWSYFVFFTRHSTVQAIFMSGAMAGTLAPVAIPLFLYFRGKKIRDEKMRTAGAMVGQAAILGILIQSIIKVFTGRIPPEARDAAAGIDISDGFRFGILKGGIWQGRPSGHTMNAFAMAFSLIFYYREKRWVLPACLAYAVFVGFAMSTSIHWLSDVFAGGLIGAAIGMTVGESFLGTLSAKRKGRKGGEGPGKLQLEAQAWFRSRPPHPWVHHFKRGRGQELEIWARRYAVSSPLSSLFHFPELTSFSKA